MNPATGKLDKLSFNSFLFKFFENMAVKIAVLPSFLALPLNATTFMISTLLKPMRKYKRKLLRTR